MENYRRQAYLDAAFRTAFCQIAAGIYGPGERLPSVREFAAQAGVNPNTMQRAMADLESQGLITTNRTAGRCVTQDMERIKQVRNSQAREQAIRF